MSEPNLPEGLPGWIRDHVKRYLESNGADGHMWDASVGGGSGMIPTLLLTTTGRTSGTPRLLPLIYGEQGGAYIVIASKGGFPTHPAWYLNLVAEPRVDVQAGSKRFKATARTATGDERAGLWRQMVALYAPYADYQKRTEREIPVVVLEPAP
jgi:proline iminopeptidase